LRLKVLYNTSGLAIARVKFNASGGRAVFIRMKAFASAMIILLECAANF
jgi:hypothetical protein